MGQRPSNRYELLSCAWSGHVLVGTDAASVGPDDALVVVEAAGGRFHRCLRCDSWIAVEAPLAPTRAEVPSRQEIELPLRGPKLRDRYVLRLIAIERGFHVVAYVVVAVAIFFFLGHRQGLQRDYNHVMADLSGTSGGVSALHGLLGSFHRLFTITNAHLWEAGLVVVFYAVLESCEMVGLWTGKRWAEYLTFVATVLLIPLEVYELASGFGWFKLVTFVLNVAIAVYLLVAKRLFGVRGGYAAEHERRERDSGWEALEAATPALPAP